MITSCIWDLKEYTGQNRVWFVWFSCPTTWKFNTTIICDPAPSVPSLKEPKGKEITGMHEPKWNGNKKNVGFDFFSLAALEEQNGDLSEIEVNEMPSLVCHVGPEVSADDAMPGRVVLLVELLLDVGGDVLLNVVLLQSLGRAVHSVLNIKRIWLSL